MVLTIASCTKKYVDYNTNPYQPTLEQKEPDSYISGENFPAMINAVTPAGDAAGRTDFVNSYQVAFNLAADAFSGFMGQAGDWGGNTNNLTYGFNLGWVNEQFNLTGKLMAAWKKLKDITDISGDSVQFSVAQVIKVTGAIRATDSYGPIPYTDIPRGTFTPVFDRQDSIYYSAFRDLIKARDILYTNGAAMGTPLAKYDLVYAGDYLKWAKYANSLILRLALRIVYADPSRAKQYAEEAISNPAGLLTAISDNAVYSLKPGNGAFNFSNPLRTLTQDYKEARAGASMQSILAGYNDPRMGVYFKTSTLPGHTTEFVGLRTGINVTRSLYQPFSELNVTDATPLPWMLASEVYFLRAEGVIRGWNMGGTARDFYESGVKTAFNEAGVAMPAGYLEDDVSRPKEYIDYANTSNNSNDVILDKKTIKWNDADEFESKLHRLMNQKWIALYPNGAEAWAEYRRTNYPRIFPVVLNRSGGIVNTSTQVRRLPYPAAQYNQNGAQVAKAISQLGQPDNGAGKLWWDKNTAIPNND